MSGETCDHCGDEVEIGGGISGIWSTKPETTGGMTFELPEGEECLLCFECLSQLPEDSTADDLAAFVDLN